MNPTTAKVGAGVIVAAALFGGVALANAPDPAPASGHSNGLEVSCDGWSATAYIYPEGSTATVVVDGGEPVVLLPGNGSGGGAWDPTEPHTATLTIDSSDDVAEGTWSKTSTPCITTEAPTTEVTPSTDATTTTTAAVTTTTAPGGTTTSPTATTTPADGATTTTTPPAPQPTFQPAESEPEPAAEQQADPLPQPAPVVGLPSTE